MHDEALFVVESQTDQAVMLTVRNGDVERISVLFHRHHRMLFNFFLRLTGNRSLSEDLVQEVFLRMLKYRQTFQPVTAGAWHGFLVRLEVAEHRGLFWNG